MDNRLAKGKIMCLDANPADRYVVVLVTGKLTGCNIHSIEQNSNSITIDKVWHSRLLGLAKIGIIGFLYM